MRNIKKLFTRDFYKKGGGEVIAFLVALPCILFLLFTIIDIIHVGSIKERLEYTAYKACRAAVVCKSKEEAEEAAKEVAKEDLLQSGEKFDFSDPDWLKVEILYADGKNGEGIDSQAKNGTKKGVSKEKNSSWEKGTFIQCKVEVQVKTLDVFSSNTKSAIITMMIEEMPSDMSIYPWFEKMG